MDEAKKYLKLVSELVRYRIHTALQRQRGVETERGTVIAEIIKMEEEINSFDKSACEKALFIPLAYFLSLYEWDLFERHVIFLMMAFELDYRFSELAAMFHENGQMGYVTPLLAREIFEYEIDGMDLSRIFREGSPLCNLLLGGQEYEYFPLQRLKPDDRMCQFLLNGCIEYDPYKRFCSAWYKSDEPPKLLDEHELLERLLKVTGGQCGRSMVLCLYGPNGIGKRAFLKRLSNKMQWTLLFLSLDALLAEGDYKKTLKLFERECYLLQAVPVIRTELQAGKNGDETEESFHYALHELLSRFALVFLTAYTRLDEKSGIQKADWVQVEMEEVSLTGSLELWRRQAKEYNLEWDASFASLVNQFSLLPGEIKKVFRLASRYSVMEGRSDISGANLRQACFSLLERGIGNKAARIQGIRSWNQLVLPEDQKNQLLSAVRQVKYKQIVYESWGMSKIMAYGNGLSILLYGPPGTGKTMAAQILAGELGLELYRVQMAAVFSKYIGETEKNLQSVFELASRNKMILFFDEADVLFSKRTEVKGSNDKFSNMEAAFLLQKMEEYEGVSILATNYYQNFDEAFKRRIRFMIEFPFPDQAARLEIWKGAAPAEMPMQDIDFEFLSSFDLTGSHIKNIVLQAAYAAAETGGPVGMEHMMRAVRQELDKIGRVLTEEEAGQYGYIFHAGQSD